MPIPLGILAVAGAGGGATRYYLSVLGGSGDEDIYRAKSAVSGNVYGVGRSNSGGNYDAILAAYNSAGTIQWQRKYGLSDFDEGYGIAVDSSENAYLGASVALLGRRYPEVAKYNSSGTIQWKKAINVTSFDDTQSLDVDSSGNVYWFSTIFDGGNYRWVIIKLDSSGNSLLQREIDSDRASIMRQIAVSSSGDIYICGAVTEPSNSYDGYVAKYNSSGTIQWQKRFYFSSGNFDFVTGIAPDTSGNVYICGYGDPVSGNNQAILAKLDSNGDITWQRNLNGSASDIFSSVFLDSAGNPYVVGQTNDSSTQGAPDWLIAKYNTSGTIQWQRILGSTGGEGARQITVESDQYLYLSGTTDAAGSGSTDFLQACIPADGSLTGTYVLDGTNFVYAASSLTAGTSSWSSGTYSFTSSTPTYTVTGGSGSDSASTLTQYVTSI